MQMTNRFNFRVYDLKKDRMIYPDGNGYLNYDNEDCVIDGNGSLFGLTSNETKDGYLMMQRTGLKDKNGKDIYEGDLIKMGDNPAEIVVWCDKCACYETINKQDWGRFKIGEPLDCYCELGYALLENNILENIEIVGNIYETDYLVEVLNKGDNLKRKAPAMQIFINTFKR